jgi:hypothetical protein
MDFSRVLVTDNLAWELFSAAAREELLFFRKAATNDDLANLSGRGGAARQRALSLLVLFDRLVVHDCSDAFRLPDLENDGIIEVHPTPEVAYDVPPLRTHWRKGPLASRGRPPKKLLQSLSLIQRLRPFVVNRILKAGKIDLFSFLASKMGVSYRRCIELFLDFATAVAQGEMTAILGNTFAKILPRDALTDLTARLFVFDGDFADAPNTAILFAILAADQIAGIQALSSKLGLGVATEHYGEIFRPETALRGKELDAIALANRFLTLRAAFAEEGGFLPRMGSLKEALRLRKDPRLQALRRQLAFFHEGLMSGNRAAVSEARREIQGARRSLGRRAVWDKALRWVTYLSVPVGVAEILSGTPPLVGTSIAVVGAAGTVGSRKVEKDNEWALFGT